MEILLTAHRFHPHVGGTELAVERLAENFARKGHAVTVATSMEPGCAAEQERNGYRIRRFEMTRLAGRFRHPPAEYRRFVLGREWDVVHLHGQRIWSTDWLYPFLGRARSPLVFTAHGFYQWHMEHRAVVDDLYYKVVLPRALRHVERVVALTDNERDELVAWGVDAARIVRVPDGFDPDEFRQLPAGFRARYSIPQDEPLLLYVGGFYRNKRVDTLVEVAARAGARLVVIGKDQDPSRGRAHAERLAKELGAKVSFLGSLPREDVLSAYRESDVFLLASDFEGYGLVLLEAMAAGLPFVSTPAGAARDLAIHGSGIVARGVTGLAEAVRSLLADDARRKTMGEQGRAKVGAYTWSRVADEYLAVFEEVRRA